MENVPTELASFIQKKNPCIAHVDRIGGNIVYFAAEILAQDREESVETITITAKRSNIHGLRAEEKSSK